MTRAITGMPAALLLLLSGAAAGAEGGITLQGRLFARSQLESERPGAPTLDLSIASARLGVRYEVTPWLGLELEAELARGPELKDAYAQVKTGALRVRAGQLKMPGPAVEQESAWRLPMARRGLLHELLGDGLQVAGRRPGVVVEWRGQGPWRPRVSGGVFQGSGADGALLKEVSPFSQSPALRLSLHPGPLEIGAFTGWRVAEPVEGRGLRRYWTAGADLSLDGAEDGAGPRLWVEAVAGASWHDRDLFDGREGTFLSGRVVAAWRFGAPGDGAFYLEPYALLGALDPALGVARDAVGEVAVGINAGLWRRARLALELQTWRRAERTPASLDVAARSAALLQLGVAF